MPSDIRIAIDESSPVPVYEQIRASIEGHIRSGVLAAGDRLPSVRQLAGDLGIAPGTVTRVYAELAQQGLIDTGLGRPARVRKITVYTDEVLEQARRYAVVAHEQGMDLADAVGALRSIWNESAPA